ncbi:unnamed protein product [Penicillium salamii]|uniref:Ribosomal RNA-processing protein 14/surfeit locus protein 6 C-terminal domain-containing protein n=1 Tax=Penicillium salamii TaxID=1612424 RepID=A0A9W4IWX8_9EURO|nr:unnamed protein product [Penicillium salamii]
MLLRFILSALCLILSVASAKHRPTVYLIRHGEKPADKEEHGLSPEGELRAQCLRHVFGKRSEYNIGYIIAPHTKRNGEHGRSLFTVQPLAKDLGLTVDTHCKRGKVRCVVEAIHSYKGPGNILISWRHGPMGKIVEALGDGVPIEYPDERHAQAFDGLLSLIPAKYYYGEEDTSDQWQRKKQTKEQAREAKRAKLDPEAAKTAKDVMDENARKRKREDGTLESDGSDGELGTENPKEGLNRGTANPKKQKPVEKSDKADPAKAAAAEERRKQKEEKKVQKKASQKEKKKAKDLARKEKTQEKKPSTTPNEESEKSATKPNGAAAKDDEESADEDDEEDDGVVEEGFSIEFNPEQENPSTSSSTPHSPDASNPQSGSSSSSSIVPLSASTEAKSSEPKPLKHTPDELKQRLQKRLDELRAKRHADGLNGKPARNRQELIEARRQKAEQRKTHKKELRQKAKDEEQLKTDEAMARRFSPGGSGSLLASPRSPAESVGSSSNNFAFGRVMFTDGQQTDIAGEVRDKHKSSGARDPAAQLKAAEAKKARLAEMDPTKRADIEDKDLWLNAKKRAHGERVRDDTSLLKKALKRKETAKKKSEREWKDRLDTVVRSKEQRQTKRDENLRKRRDEKGNKGGKKKPSSSGGKKKARPGFEGSFKGGGKKK